MALNSNEQIRHTDFVTDTDGRLITSRPSYNALFSSIYDGRKLLASAFVREALASSTACHGVKITALRTNIGFIQYGSPVSVNATVSTATGGHLAAGDFEFLAVNTLSAVGLASEISGEGVSYFYYG